MMERPAQEVPDLEIAPLADDPNFMKQLTELGLPPDVVTREGFRRFIESEPTWMEWLAEVIKHDPREAFEEARTAGPEALGLGTGLPPEPEAVPAEEPGFSEGGLVTPELRNTLRTDPRYSGWWNAYMDRYGEEPDLAGGDYDYGEAVRNGVAPTPYEHDRGFPHWPSSTPEGTMLKGENHPSAWMERFTRENGFDPNEINGYEHNRFAAGGFLSSPQTEVEQAGGSLEPVPPGSLPEEVADDVDAKLSVGEVVIPADVVRWHGVKTFEAMRAEAKDGFAAMEGEGRIQAPGGLMAPPELPEDDAPFLDPEVDEDAPPAPLGFAAGGLVTAPYTDQFGRGTFAPTTPMPQTPGSFANTPMTPTPQAPAVQAPEAPTPQLPAPNNNNSSWVAPAAAAAVAAVGTTVSGSPTPAAPPPQPSGDSGSIWDTVGDMALNQAGKGLLGYVAANAVTAPGADLAGTAGGGFGNIVQDAGAIVDGIGSAVGTAGADLGNWASGIVDSISAWGTLASTNPAAAAGQLAGGLASTAMSAGASMIGGYLGNLVGYELFGPGDAEQRPVATGIGVAGGALIGAKVGSVVPVIGTVIGAAIGAFLGAILGSSMGGSPDYPYSWVSMVVNATEDGAQLNRSAAGAMNHASAAPADRFGVALHQYLKDRAAEEGYVLNNERVNRPTFYTGTYKDQLFYRPAWSDPEGYAVKPESAAAYTTDARAIADLVWRDSVGHGLFVRPDENREWASVRADLEAAAAADQGYQPHTDGEGTTSVAYVDGRPWHAQHLETTPERIRREAQEAEWAQMLRDNPYLMGDSGTYG